MSIAHHVWSICFDYFIFLPGAHQSFKTQLTTTLRCLQVEPKGRLVLKWITCLAIGAGEVFIFIFVEYDAYWNFGISGKCSRHTLNRFFCYLNLFIFNPLLSLFQLSPLKWIDERYELSKFLIRSYRPDKCGFQLLKTQTFSLTFTTIVGREGYPGHNANAEIQGQAHLVFNNPSSLDWAVSVRSWRDLMLKGSACIDGKGARCFYHPEVYFGLSAGQDMDTQGERALTEVEVGVMSCYAPSCLFVPSVNTGVQFLTCGRSGFRHRKSG